MRQARTQLAPVALATAERPHAISAGPGTTVSAHLPDAAECRLYGLAPGAPVLVITRPDGQQLIAPASLTAVVFGDLADPLPPDQADQAALYVLGVIREELANVAGRVSHLAAALRCSPGSVASLAEEYRDERALENFCDDPGLCEHAAAALAAAAREKVPAAAGSR